MPVSAPSDKRFRRAHVTPARKTRLLNRPSGWGVARLSVLLALVMYGGYRAIRWLAWRLPATWLIAPLLYLPGMTWLGQKLYMAVARNRFKIIPCEHGVCKLPQART